MSHATPPTMSPPGSYGSGQSEAPGATAGLVLGILSIVFNAPIIGLILAFIGFNQSKQAKALCAANAGMYSNAGVAQAGYICSIIGLVLGSLSTLCTCGYLIVAAGILGIGAGAAGGGGP